MSPRRSHQSNSQHWETAAPEYEEGSGCFSVFLLPPLMVILLSGLFGYFIWNRGIPRATLPPVSGVISPIFRAEVQYWSGSISQWAGAAGLDPNLVATVMQIESCGDPRATSSAGAMGLFQVMPFHFRAGDDPYAPDTNAARGLAYLAQSLQAASGDARLALAGYNGGIGVIPRGELSLAAETQRYIRYGAPIYEDAKSGKTFSYMLDEWYKRYGVNLCRQASRRLGLE